MTSTTLQTSHVESNPSSSIAAAVHELFSAARHLLVALWNTTTHAPRAALQALSAYEEAEQLRAIADEYISKDPRFAQDLYGAADRHERSGNSILTSSTSRLS
jgi:hypothetical protein